MKRYTSVWRAGLYRQRIVGMLEAAGQNVWVPPRGGESVFDTDLGTVICSAGQGDCRMLRWGCLMPIVVCWPICWHEASLSVSFMSLPPVYT